VTRVGWRPIAAGLVITAVISGCGAAGSSSPAGGASGTGTAGPAAAYWNRARLLGARPLRRWTQPVTPSATPSGHAPVLPAPRVGALFAHNASGNHFCTASVVASPGHDLLITAAHCINGGKGSGYNQDIVFVPGYENGSTPLGVWTPSKLLVAPQWATSSDPDFDVGFVVLKPLNGKNVQDVLGANQLGFNAGFTNLVRVTGYPASANAPVTCLNWTSQQSTTQLKFACGGYYGGTSGSPWLTHFDVKSLTGTIVGVIGGYQQGGDTPSVSYSAYLDDAIRQLYQQAEAAS
jgi:V8-like Glu-specific endopeptidase